MNITIETPTELPITLPPLNTEYWYLTLKLSTGKYTITRCRWQGYLSDRARYLSNYYTSEREAWEAADKMNVLLGCMVQPEERVIAKKAKQKKKAVKATHPDVLP